MCGIIGVASTEGSKNRIDRINFMKIGLDIDSWRGWESTGMALIPEASKEAPIVYKRALNGRDFIQLRKVEKYLDDMDKYSVVIGHNRAATVGRGNIIDHNAHPFQYGNITLVHNGHIRNTHELPGAQSGSQCLVDSAHVAYSMDANGELETLSLVDGGFVFVWWNSETNTLNIARNTERPLYMAFAAKENTFYWASELTELLHLLKEVDIDEDVGILFPKAWIWYQFNIKNLREYTKTPFAKRQGRHHSQKTIYPVGVPGLEEWSSEELEEMERTQLLAEVNTVGRRLTSKSDSDEVEEIRQTVANQRLKDIKASGVPTSRKRIARARAELKNLGIEFNAMKSCTPMSWTQYKNQTNLGSVLARTKSEGLLVEVLQVRDEDYRDYHRIGNLLVDCVNVRNGPHNDVRVIGVVSSRMAAYAARKKAEEAETSSPGGGSIERIYEGPGGQKISLARFLELTTNGCGACSGDISAVQHKSVFWMLDSPICETCSTNPATMESLGFPLSNERRVVTSIH